MDSHSTVTRGLSTRHKRILTCLKNTTFLRQYPVPAALMTTLQWKFFGTLKTECLYRAKFSSRQELEQLIDEYIYFYNFERITLNNGLTPNEIRSKAA